MLLERVLCGLLFCIVAMKISVASWYKCQGTGAAVLLFVDLKDGTFFALGGTRRSPFGSATCLPSSTKRLSPRAGDGSCCSMCAKSMPDSRERDSLERDWGRRIPKAIRHPRALAPAPPARQSNGEYWWRLALEKHKGEVGTFSQTIPWEALCQHGLAAYFLEVLGDEGRDRPLVVSKPRG